MGDKEPLMMNPRGLVLVTMIALAAATRFIPPLAAPWVSLWNFTAIGAMCLFGGAHFQRKAVAFSVPLAALFLSDVALALVLYGFKGFPVISVSYVLFGLTTLLGMALRNRVTFVNVTAAAIVAGVGFFLLSNFHVWLTGYDAPRTAATLVETYVAAIPFATNMLLGNLVYSAALFGGYALLTRELPVLRQPALQPVRV
jgi:hypothetical protein